MKKNKILKINLFMFILFFIMLLTLGIDCLTYFFNLNYLFSFSISLIFNGIITYFLLKKIEIKTNFEKNDFIFFAILFGIFIITIVYPDRSFDTFNYHLYLQENPFGDKINFDFFAGKNLNSFSYAFPDRMFYLFRYFLGYRLGVILNYLIITTIYYQAKEILKKLLPDAKSLTIVVFSTLIATSLSLIDIVDSYYIDLISAVLLLEVFRLLFVEKIDTKNSTYMLGYYALLFGFSFVTKISNAVTLVLFFIIFIVLNRKDIKKYINIKNILITFGLLFIPFILYLLYTWSSTGNPVFPFYNTIFHSKYFGNWNWLDTRFGPHSIIGVIVYPVTMLLNGNRACDIGIVEPIWTYGYFVAIIYIGYYLYKKIVKKGKIDSNRLFLAIVTILVYLIWAKFQLGYTRYGFISLILGSIVTYTLIYDLFKNKKVILLSIITVLMLYNFSYNAINYMGQNKDWIYHNFYNGSGQYKYNLKNLFARGNETQIELEDGSLWGIIYNNSGYAQIFNNKVPMVSLNDGADNKYSKKILNDKISSATHIYTLVDALDLDNFIRRLNDAHYKIISIKDVKSSNIISRSNSFTYIFELEKDAQYVNNYERFEEKTLIDTKNKNTISFNLGIDIWTNGVYEEDRYVTIYGINNNEETIIDRVSLSKDGYMKKLHYNVEEYDSIKVSAPDTWMVLLNVDEN